MSAANRRQDRPCYVSDIPAKKGEFEKLGRKCQHVASVKRSGIRMRCRESDRTFGSVVLDATQDGGATVRLLLCGIACCLLLAGCKKGVPQNEAIEQASAKDTATNEAATNEALQRQITRSQHNLKQIALAFHNYHDTYKVFPAAVQTGPKNVPHSWRVTILQFLGHSALFDRYHLDEPWDSEHNKTLLAEMPDVLRAPGTASTSNTSYLGFTPANPSSEPRNAPTPAVGGTNATKIRDIIDGTSNTILVVESKLDVPWTQPTDLPFDPNQPLPKMGGIHADGFYAALCDGSTTFIPDSYDRGMLLDLIDRGDRNLVQVPAAIERERVAKMEQQQRQKKQQEERKRLAASMNPFDISANNLKRVALAMHNYHDTYKRFPAAVQVGPKDVPRSWRVTILPFIEQGELYERYRQDEPWDSAHNITLLPEMPDVYRAPGSAASSKNASYFGFTPTGNAEPDMNRLPALAGSRNVRFANIIDGTSNSLLVAESKRDVPWTQPTDLPFNADQPAPAIGGVHDNGFFAAMCDGRVVFFPDSYDRNMLMKVLLFADGKPVQLPSTNQR